MIICFDMDNKIEKIITDLHFLSSILIQHLIRFVCIQIQIVQIKSNKNKYNLLWQL